MWKWRSFAALLLWLWLSPPAFATAAEPPPASGSLPIGSISEVDTARIRQIIDAARAELAPPSPPEAGALRLTLEQAIRTALEGNLRLQIATIDRDVGEAEVPATRAKFHPVLGFDTQYNDEHLVDAPESEDEDEEDDDAIGQIQEGTQRSSEVSAGPFVRQELPSAGTINLLTDLIRDSEHEHEDLDPPGTRVTVSEDDYEGGMTLELRQPLLRGGSVWVARREIYDAEYILAGLEAGLQAEILRVTAETKEAYYNVLLAQRLIEVTEQAIERDLRLIDASVELSKAGRASTRDVVSAEIRLADDQSLLAQRRGELERFQLSLRDVLGLGISEPVWAADTTIPFEPIPIRQEQWIEQALANRPEIRQVLARLEQSTVAVHVAENAVMPQLDFLGTYRRADFDRTSRTVYGGADSWIWTAGLHFEIPFGNVAARERLREARLKQERVERELRQQKRAIEIEVRTEVIGLRESLENLAAQNAKVEDSRAKLQIANTRYQLGLANNLDVTDAQEDLVNAESDLLSAIVGYVNGLARLEARIAGSL